MKEDILPEEVMAWSRLYCGDILDRLTSRNNDLLTDIVFFALNSAFHNNFVEESEYIKDGLGLSRLEIYCREDKTAIPIAKEFIERLKHVPDLCGYNRMNIAEFKGDLVA
jgi:hypothetical protein